jgi:uncharacterized membrane protein YdbT with pleckstrin-like domain
VVFFGGIAALVGFSGHPGWGVLLAGVALLFSASGIYNLLYLRTIEWIITDEEMRVKSGILPWRKRSFDHPYETIFEAYFNFGFFAKIFGYGTCVIRRTEGNTTAETESYMHDAKKITGLINARVKELRKAQRPATLAPTTRSAVQELADLAKLKAAGDISVEEFETMKGKIVAGIDAVGRDAIHDRSRTRREVAALGR